MSIEAGVGGRDRACRGLEATSGASSLPVVRLGYRILVRHLHLATIADDGPEA